MFSSSLFHVNQTNYFRSENRLFCLFKAYFDGCLDLLRGCSDGWDGGDNPKLGRRHDILASAPNQGVSFLAS